jgi:hypothetical protein
VRLMAEVAANVVDDRLRGLNLDDQVTTMKSADVLEYSMELIVKVSDPGFEDHELLLISGS